MLPSMDWTPAITTILVVFGMMATVAAWLSSKINGVGRHLDTKIDRIDTKIETVRKELSAEITRNREELIWVRYHLDPESQKRAIPEEYKPPEQ